MVVEAGGAIVGFGHTLFGHDPRWGSLLDNLHVAHDRRRQGIGTGLLAETARVFGGSAPTPALFTLGARTERRGSGLLRGEGSHVCRTRSGTAARWRSLPIG
ncbi:MAG: GNAT family N-acetyltransferase [Acidimicrobiales bacterium]